MFFRLILFPKILRFLFIEKRRNSVSCILGSLSDCLLWTTFTETPTAAYQATNLGYQRPSSAPERVQQRIPDAVVNLSSENGKKSRKRSL